MNDLLIARIIIDLKAQLVLVAFLAVVIVALAALCVHLWKRLGRLEFSLLQFRAYTNGDLDGMKVKVDMLFKHLPASIAEMDAEVDEILSQPLVTPAIPPLLPPTVEATVTPIGRGEEIRKTSVRPPGKPPSRPLGAPKARRLERPGLRPQEKRGPFSGKPPDNPFDDC